MLLSLMEANSATALRVPNTLLLPQTNTSNIIFEQASGFRPIAHTNVLPLFLTAVPKTFMFSTMSLPLPRPHAEAVTAGLRATQLASSHPTTCMAHLDSSTRSHLISSQAAALLAYFKVAE